MDDRFKFRIRFTTDNKTINGTFKNINTCYCNGFCQCKIKTHFYGNNKKFSILNSQIISIEQCTGLKDKNGKLIYEGDILRKPVSSEYDKKNFVAFEVFWHDNDCCIEHIGWQMNRLHFQGCLCGANTYGFRFKQEVVSKMEIIGNVYENKELLND